MIISEYVVSVLTEENDQRWAEGSLMALGLLLAHGSRSQQEDTAVATVWGVDAEVLHASDAATITARVLVNGARDIATVSETCVTLKT